MFSTEQIQGWIDQGIALVIARAPGLLLALVVLLVGLWLIARVSRLVAAGLRKAEVDDTLAKFLVSLISVSLKVLLFISVVQMIGVETTSFIALLGAAGLAVGLALQGSLANFAGGVLILLFRPFRVGDVVETEGVTGTVAAIQIFSTIILTPDRKRVIVPNGPVANGVITNYSAEATRRVDFVFGIGYDDDLRRAKAVLQRIISEEARILREPEPLVVVSELADSSVNFTVRVWVNAADYWGVYFDTIERVKLVFDEEGISIPFPQRDVHVYRDAA
ncbi:MAG: mechanosensitive ion channel [Pseudomonadales bacterium]|nr:mechanosensitive ion channel [Pseudomonadales bacterium]